MEYKVKNAPSSTINLLYFLYFSHFFLKDKEKYKQTIDGHLRSFYNNLYHQFDVSYSVYFIQHKDCDCAGDASQSLDESFIFLRCAHTNYLLLQEHQN